MNKQNKISKLNNKMANPLDWLWEPSLPWMGRKNSKIKEQKRNSKKNGEERKENSHKYSNFIQTYLKLNDHNTKRLTLFILILEANLYMYIIWIQAIKTRKLSNMEAWTMSFGLLELQKCQKHCTYLKLGWKNVFPNSDQLVASEACLKRHLLTKWSSVKLEIWVLSFKWPSFSPRGGL